MIKQDIYLNKQRIFTIIHKNMDKNMENRNIENSVELYEHEILFKEVLFEDSCDNDLKYDFIIGGFLPCTDKKKSI